MTTYGITRKEGLNKTRWSGGTTTQLAIYPPEAVYAERNFKWRVSTAVIDAEESEFTPLPGAARIIMVLDGLLELKHEGHHDAVLTRFGQDAFMGDWQTVSRGRVRDFNLMMQGGCGRLDVIRIGPYSEHAVGQMGSVLHELEIMPHNGGYGLLFGTGEPAGFDCVSEVYYFTEGGDSQLVTPGAREAIRNGDVVTITGRTGGSGKPDLKIVNDTGGSVCFIRALIFYDE